ncbi:MAG: DUF2341 domain-containing protein, partial [Ekhidna sp.]|nr:DUF2341 domain-containing protein [Ekhidna sp.]
MSKGFLLNAFFPLATFFFSFSQSGPGGVGNSSTLRLWLRSSDITVGDGNEVLFWPDTSGNDHDFTGLAGSGTRPTLDIDGLNGFPGVLFGGDGARMQDDDGEDYINGLDALTIITLIQSDELSTVDVGIFDSQGDNGTDDALTWRYDNAGANGGGDDVIKWGLGPNNTAQLESADNTHTINPQLLLGTWTSGDIMRLYLDGTLNVPTANDPAWTGTISNADRTVLGRGPKDDDDNQGWDGYIVEFALLNFSVNEAERTLIENYLAAKYNLSIVNDIYAFQSTHGNDVAGVGNSGGDLQTSAVSSKVLGLAVDGANLDDGDFVMFGHDGGGIDSWLATEQPLADTNFLRLEREWVFDTTSSPGIANISIDTTLLPAKTTDFEFYYLWLDADGDFTSGATPYLLSAVADSSIYQATGITLSDGLYASISLHRSVINFSPTAFNGFETDGATSADFTVQIPYEVYKDVAIDYELSMSSTYNDNNPAITTPATVTITAGNTTETISIAMNGDTDDESDETIILDLDGTTGVLAVVGADSVGTYTINDNDGGDPTIQFDAPFSYAKKKTITIDQSMVSGSTDLEDFPVLIRVTGADFDDIDSVQTQNNGYDVRFTYENSLVWLEHQIETYDQVNKEFLAWIKLPVLSSSENTKLEMYYGNSSAITDPSVLSTFDTSRYEGVYHLDDASDNTSNGNNGTAISSPVFQKAYIGDGVETNGADYIDIPDSPSLSMPLATEAFTLSVWVKTTDGGGDIISSLFNVTGGSLRGYSIRFLSNELSFLFISNWSSDAIRVATSAAALNDDEWHHLVATYDGSADATGVTIYVDGVATSTDITQLVSNLSPTDVTDHEGPLYIGRRPNGGQQLTASVDEARVIRGVLDADWIATEYQNQDSSTNFITYAIGTDTDGFNITEATDTVAFTVALSAVNAGATTVDYEIVDVSTSAGNDYVVSSGTVTIPADELSSTFTVDLNNDGVDESDETFKVNLFNPSSNANLGSNNTIDVTILDDDNAPVLSLADTLISVNEGTSIVGLTVNLSAASGSNVAVDYTVTGNTAQAGSDFTFPNGTLTIPSGSTSGTINFNIIDDVDIEVLEDFSVQLSNPLNASINSDFDVVKISINDNDNLGIDGPGGVGDKDGTGTLVMWSIADSVQTSGSDVTTWPNEVGISELDLTPFGTAPVKVDNARNGHAEVSFAAGVNDGIRTDFLSASYFPYNEATTFIITRHDNRNLRSSTYATATSISGDIGSPRFSTHLPWNGSLYYDIGNCCNADGRVGPITYELEWEGEYGIFAFRTGEDEGKEVWRNNTSLATVAGTDNFTNHNNYQFYLGHADIDPFAGDILEFVMFTNPLNNAQVNIVNNYLAAKYDLAIENDLFAFNTTHSNDVAGIGYEDASNFHNAAKTDFLTISNASDLGQGEYIMLGHDNEFKNAWVTSDVPSDISNLQRIQREWRVDTTGTPGTVSLSIDTTSLPAKSVGYTEYVILTDDDGDFTDGASIFPTTKVDGEYLANDVTLGLGTYVSVGIIIRTIEFVGNANQDFEFNNNTLTVSLSLRSTENVSVDYNISGTATQGSDFSLASSGIITIPAGSLSATVDLGIIDESDEESDETVIVQLSNPPSGYLLGSDFTFTYTINDDDLDRTVNFDLFKYSRQVIVPSANVSADITDYPLYFEFTDVSMRQLGDSDGLLENTSGFDISFYDSASAQFLDHQLEFYDAVTGKIAVWVRIPTLSSSQDNEFTFLYGNAGIQFDQSSDSVWREDFAGVWHMSNGDYTDASLNGNNGTNQGATTVDGKIGQAGSFDGLSNVEIANDPTLTFDEDSTFTLSLWYNGTDVSSSLLGKKNANANDQGYSIFISNTNRALGRLDNAAGGEDRIRAQNTAINDGNWNHIVLTYDGIGAGRTGSIYVNGVEDNTILQTDNGGLSDDDDISPNVPFTIGSISNSAAISGAITGLIDEVRVMGTVLGAQEIAISYANQNDPTSFYSVGAQDTTSVSVEETDGTIAVRVRVEPIDETQATTVDFEDTGSGTAIVSEDFNITSGTLTIPAGSKTGTFNFSV